MSRPAGKPGYGLLAPEPVEGGGDGKGIKERRDGFLVAGGHGSPSFSLPHAALILERATGDGLTLHRSSPALAQRLRAASGRHPRRGQTWTSRPVTKLNRMPDL